MTIRVQLVDFKFRQSRLRNSSMVALVNDMITEAKLQISCNGWLSMGIIIRIQILRIFGRNIKHIRYNAYNKFELYPCPKKTFFFQLLVFVQLLLILLSYFFTFLILISQP